MNTKIFAIIFICMVSLTSTSALSVTQIKVKIENYDIQLLNSMGGNTLYVGGSGPNNYTSIQSAINVANSGNTIFVYDDSSPYYENIVIDKSISLIGENKNTTIIDGDGGNAINISADLVNISGFTIQNSIFGGIEIYSNFNNISKNNIKGNIAGIYLFTNANNNTIYENNINSNLFRGIYAVSSGHNIKSNIISFNNGAGMELMDSTNSIISGNLIRSNLEGISLCGGSNNIISENIILNNSGCIDFLGGHDNLLFNNNFLKNDYGMTLRSCNNNFLFHNNFIDNTEYNVKEYFCDYNTWDNGYPSGGNYWSDYNGLDKDNDGIGDKPYYIPEDNYNEDRYPLMNLYGKENHAPNKPSKPSGPTNGKPFFEYTYTTSTTDPDGDLVRYCWYWELGDIEWTPFYQSGETISTSHRWDDAGIHLVKVKAEDIYGFESEWSDPLIIIMPVDLSSSQQSSPTPQSQPSSQQIFQLFQNLILQHQTMN